VRTWLESSSASLAMAAMKASVTWGMVKASRSSSLYAKEKALKRLESTGMLLMRAVELVSAWAE